MCQMCQMRTTRKLTIWLMVANRSVRRYNSCWSLVNTQANVDNVLSGVFLFIRSYGFHFLFIIISSFLCNFPLTMLNIAYYIQPEGKTYQYEKIKCTLYILIKLLNLQKLRSTHKMPLEQTNIAKIRIKWYCARDCVSVCNATEWKARKNKIKRHEMKPMNEWMNKVKCLRSEINLLHWKDSM